MRAVLQRVSRAGVTVDGSRVAEIDGGLLVLLGVGDGDTEEDASTVADKIVGMRIFRDDEGLMNRSVVDVGGAVLVVSQFTLLADLRKGRRPSFVGAADPERAEALVAAVAAGIAASGVEVRSGVFGALMEVELVNDGPVTIVVDVESGKVR
jgi:D-aminoacyl-tRNA deacylase